MLHLSIAQKAALAVALPATAVFLYFLLKKNEDDDDDASRGSIVSSRHTVIEVKVPPSAVGTIIGQSGVNIKKIKEETGASLNFDDRNKTKDNEDRILIIRGSYESTQQAQLAVLKIIADIPPVISEELFVPESSLGRIIGRNGDTIRLLMRTSKARINIDKTEQRRPDTKRSVIIKGTVEAVANAKGLIEEKISEEEAFRSKIAVAAANRSERGPGRKRKTLSNGEEKNSLDDLGRDQNGSGEPHMSTQEVEAPLEAVSQARELSSEPSQFSVNGHPSQSEGESIWPKHRDYLEVYVSAVEHPGHFWVQVVNSKSIILDSLIDDMTQFYSQEDSSQLDTDFNPQPGDMVAAVFVHDKRWYRARVLDIAEDSVDCYFVDFGDSEVVPRESITFLKSEFLSLPFQAVECKLANIKPKGEHWCEDATIVFEEKTHVAKWVVLMAKTNSYWQVDEVFSVPCIELFDTNSEQDINVGEELVKQGLAVWDKDPEEENKVAEGSPKMIGLNYWLNELKEVDALEEDELFNNVESQADNHYKRESQFLNDECISEIIPKQAVEINCMEKKVETNSGANVNVDVNEGGRNEKRDITDFDCQTKKNFVENAGALVTVVETEDSCGIPIVMASAKNDITNSQVMKGDTMCKQYGDVDSGKKNIPGFEPTSQVEENDKNRYSGIPSQDVKDYEFDHMERASCCSSVESISVKDVGNIEQCLSTINTELFDGFRENKSDGNDCLPEINDAKQLDSDMSFEKFHSQLFFLNDGSMSSENYSKNDSLSNKSIDGSFDRDFTDKSDDCEFKNEQPNLNIVNPDELPCPSLMKKSDTNSSLTLVRAKFSRSSITSEDTSSECGLVMDVDDDVFEQFSDDDIHNIIEPNENQPCLDLEAATEDNPKACWLPVSSGVEKQLQTIISDVKQYQSEAGGAKKVKIEEYAKEQISETEKEAEPSECTQGELHDVSLKKMLITERCTSKGTIYTQASSENEAARKDNITSQTLLNLDRKEIKNTEAVKTEEKDPSENTEQNKCKSVCNTTAMGNLQGKRKEKDTSKQKSKKKSGSIAQGLKLHHEKLFEQQTVPLQGTESSVDDLNSFASEDFKDTLDELDDSQTAHTGRENEAVENKNDNKMCVEVNKRGKYDKPEIEKDKKEENSNMEIAQNTNQSRDLPRHSTSVCKEITSTSGLPADYGNHSSGSNESIDVDQESHVYESKSVTSESFQDYSDDNCNDRYHECDNESDSEDYVAVRYVGDEDQNVKGSREDLKTDDNAEKLQRDEINASKLWSAEIKDPDVTDSKEECKVDDIVEKQQTDENLDQRKSFLVGNEYKNETISADEQADSSSDHRISLSIEENEIQKETNSIEQLKTSDIAEKQQTNNKSDQRISLSIEENENQKETKLSEELTKNSDIAAKNQTEESLQQRRLSSSGTEEQNEKSSRDQQNNESPKHEELLSREVIGDQNETHSSKEIKPSESSKTCDADETLDHQKELLYKVVNDNSNEEGIYVSNSESPKERSEITSLELFIEEGQSDLPVSQSVEQMVYSHVAANLECSKDLELVNREKEVDKNDQLQRCVSEGDSQNITESDLKIEENYISDTNMCPSGEIEETCDRKQSPELQIVEITKDTGKDLKTENVDVGVSIAPSLSAHEQEKGQIEETLELNAEEADEKVDRQEEVCNKLDDTSSDNIHKDEKELLISESAYEAECKTLHDETLDVIDSIQLCEDFNKAELVNKVEKNKTQSDVSGITVEHDFSGNFVESERSGVDFEKSQPEKAILAIPDDISKEKAVEILDTDTQNTHAEDISYPSLKVEEFKVKKEKVNEEDTGVFELSVACGESVQQSAEKKVCSEAIENCGRHDGLPKTSDGQLPSYPEVFTPPERKQNEECNSKNSTEDILTLSNDILYDAKQTAESNEYVFEKPIHSGAYSGSGNTIAVTKKDEEIPDKIEVEYDTCAEKEMLCEPVNMTKDVETVSCNSPGLPSGDLVRIESSEDLEKPPKILLGLSPYESLSASPKNNRSRSPSLHTGETLMRKMSDQFEEQDLLGIQACTTDKNETKEWCYFCQLHGENLCLKNHIHNEQDEKELSKLGEDASIQNSPQGCVTSEKELSIQEIKGNNQQVEIQLDGLCDKEPSVKEEITQNDCDQTLMTELLCHKTEEESEQKTECATNYLEARTVDNEEKDDGLHMQNSNGRFSPEKLLIDEVLEDLVQESEIIIESDANLNVNGEEHQEEQSEIEVKDSAKAESAIHERLRESVEDEEQSENKLDLNSEDKQTTIGEEKEQSGENQPIDMLSECDMKGLIEDTQAASPIKKETVDGDQSYRNREQIPAVEEETKLQENDNQTEKGESLDKHQVSAENVGCNVIERNMSKEEQDSHLSDMQDHDECLSGSEEEIPKPPSKDDISVETVNAMLTSGDSDKVIFQKQGNKKEDVPIEDNTDSNVLCEAQIVEATGDSDEKLVKKEADNAVDTSIQDTHFHENDCDKKYIEITDSKSEIGLKDTAIDTLEICSLENSVLKESVNVPDDVVGESDDFQPKICLVKPAEEFSDLEASKNRQEKTTETEGGSEDTDQNGHKIVTTTPPQLQSLVSIPVEAETFIEEALQDDKKEELLDRSVGDYCDIESEICLGAQDDTEGNISRVGSFAEVQLTSNESKVYEELMKDYLKSTCLSNSHSENAEENIAPEIDTERTLKSDIEEMAKDYLNVDSSLDLESQDDVNITDHEIVVEKTKSNSDASGDQNEQSYENDFDTDPSVCLNEHEIDEKNCQNVVPKEEQIGSELTDYSLNNAGSIPVTSPVQEVSSQFTPNELEKDMLDELESDNFCDQSIDSIDDNLQASHDDCESDPMVSKGEETYNSAPNNEIDDLKPVQEIEAFQILNTTTSADTEKLDIGPPQTEIHCQVENNISDSVERSDSLPEIVQSVEDVIDAKQDVSPWPETDNSQVPAREKRITDHGKTEEVAMVAESCNKLEVSATSKDTSDEYLDDSLDELKGKDILGGEIETMNVIGDEAAGDSLEDRETGRADGEYPVVVSVLKNNVKEFTTGVIEAACVRPYESVTDTHGIMDDSLEILDQEKQLTDIGCNLDQDSFDEIPSKSMTTDPQDTSNFNLEKESNDISKTVCVPHNDIVEKGHNDDTELDESQFYLTCAYYDFHKEASPIAGNISKDATGSAEQPVMNRPAEFNNENSAMLEVIDHDSSIMLPAEVCESNVHHQAYALEPAYGSYFRKKDDEPKYSPSVKNLSPQNKLTVDVDLNESNRSDSISPSSWPAHVGLITVPKEDNINFELASSKANPGEYIEVMRGCQKTNEPLTGAYNFSNKQESSYVDPARKVVKRARNIAKLAPAGGQVNWQGLPVEIPHDLGLTEIPPDLIAPIVEKSPEKKKPKPQLLSQKYHDMQAKLGAKMRGKNLEYEDDEDDKTPPRYMTKDGRRVIHGRAESKSLSPSSSRSVSEASEGEPQSGFMNRVILAAHKPLQRVSKDQRVSELSQVHVPGYLDNYSTADTGQAQPKMCQRPGSSSNVMEDSLEDATAFALAHHPQNENDVLLENLRSESWGSMDTPQYASAAEDFSTTVSMTSASDYLTPVQLSSDSLEDFKDVSSGILPSIHQFSVYPDVQSPSSLSQDSLNNSVEFYNTSSNLQSEAYQCIPRVNSIDSCYSNDSMDAPFVDASETGVEPSSGQLGDTVFESDITPTTEYSNFLQNNPPLMSSSPLSSHLEDAMGCSGLPSQARNKADSEHDTPTKTFFIEPDKWQELNTQSDSDCDSVDSIEMNLPQKKS